MSNNLDMAQIRADLGITQAQLGELLNVDRKYISMIETGTKPLSSKLSKKLDTLIHGNIHANGITVNGGIIGHNGTVTTTQKDMLNGLEDMRDRLTKIETDLTLVKKLLAQQP